jgi:site-specific DNA-methyltransferase (cytosine-N4-specific)
MSVKILIGDVRERLRDLPDNSVDCVVTSPPYWGLRDYGTATWEGGDAGCIHKLVDPERLPWANSVKGPGNPGKNGSQYAMMTKEVGGYCEHCGAHRKDRQLGLEPSWQTHVETMADVFDEVRRVLKPEGTLWLNYGDSYATSVNGRSAADTKAVGNDDRTFRDKPFSTVGGVLKPKDLCGIPWRVAFALQERGWWLRQDIIWSKPNPMPESIRDRCTKAHEYLFLLAKSERYYFDQESILEPCSPNTHARLSQDVQAQLGSDRVPGKTNGRMKAVGRHLPGNKTHKGTTAYEAGDEYHRTKGGLVAYSERQRKLADAASGTKNNTSFDAAMAIMPEKRNRRSVWEVTTQPFSEAHFATFPPQLIEPCILAGCPEGGTVLDPFFGAGTTGLVADRLGRNCIGIELNPEYAEMAQRRIEGDAPMFANVEAA